jgi:hypothetical protein
VKPRPPKVTRTDVWDGSEDSVVKKLEGKLTLLNGTEVKIPRDLQLQALDFGFAPPRATLLRDTYKI